MSVGMTPVTKHCVLSAEESAVLGSNLSKLYDCDLQEWDRDFIEDMIERHDMFGIRTNITAKQADRMDRIIRKYSYEW